MGFFPHKVRDIDQNWSIPIDRESHETNFGFINFRPNFASNTGQSWTILIDRELHGTNFGLINFGPNFASNTDQNWTMYFGPILEFKIMGCVRTVCGFPVRIGAWIPG